MKITKNFDSNEFSCHDAVNKAYPQIWLKTRLKPLCELLEVIRAEVKVPITIISGYRTPEYNKKINGAEKSYHMLGIAADIAVRGMPAHDVHELILKLYNDGKLPLLGGIGRYKSFVHVDLRPFDDELVQWDG